MFDTRPGKQPHNYGKSPCLMGETHYFYGHFQSLCKRLPEGTYPDIFLVVFHYFAGFVPCIDMHSHPEKMPMVFLKHAYQNGHMIFYLLQLDL